MPIRPRKPRPEGPRPRSKKAKRLSLDELNSFAAQMAEKYFGQFSAGEVTDNGPFLDPKGRIGGGFFAPGMFPPPAVAMPPSTPPTGEATPGTIIYRQNSQESWLRTNTGWESVRNESIIDNLNEIDKILKEPLEPEESVPTMPPSKYGRKIRLKPSSKTKPSSKED